MSEDGIERHRAECGTCDTVLAVEDGTVDGFKRAEDALTTHIDDGTPCHGGRVMAETEGGERRVL